LCTLCLICGFFGEVLVGPEGVWGLDEGEGPRHLFWFAACLSFGLMDFRDENCGIHVLGEGVSEEACVCPVEDVAVVRFELNMGDVLMVGAIDGDSGGGLIFTGVYMVVIMSYVWGLAIDMTNW